LVVPLTGQDPDMDNESAKKAAKNEAISRSLNEGLAKGEDRWPSEEPTFICECSDLSCTLPISLSIERYREVRSDPARFVLIAGHLNPEIERKVEEGEGFEIVEKIGPGKEVAERTA
jgi:hypothetical protein